MTRTSVKSFTSEASGESKHTTNTGTGSNAPTVQPKSILEALDASQSSGELKAFLYRLTVVGAYDGPTPEDIIKLNDKIIADINGACYDEPGTGFLAVYPNHFLHLLEGSEDTLNKYVEACAIEIEDKQTSPDSAQPGPDDQTGFNVQLKILSYVRISGRSADKWISLRRESGEFDLLQSIHGFKNRLYEFVKKVWILSTVLPIFLQPEDVTQLQNMLEFEDPEDQLLVQEAAINLRQDLDQELNKYFPTSQMLQFFMKPKVRLPPLRTPREHIAHTWNLPRVIFESETVWPIPSRLARYD